MGYKTGSDKVLLAIAGLLTVLGLLMVYNTSSVVASSEPRLSFDVFLKQFLYACAGFAILVHLMHVDYRKWREPKVLVPLLALCALALIVVLTQTPVKGASRWIRIGGLLSFQPSEAAKLAVIVFIAAFLHKYEDEVRQPTRRFLLFIAVILFFAGAVVVEPDLGQAVCILFIAGVMLFVAGLSWKYFAYAGAVFLPLVGLMILLEPYRLKRLFAFWDPYMDPHGIGWQTIQSLTAVGSGGFTGMGLGAGKQKLFFLPEASSDFIFAVIGEELGLLGTVAITVAFFIFFLRGMRIVLRSTDRFGYYLALGITLMVALQGFINISMVLAMMPTKGIALPFISQGGSSLLLNLTATGILLNCSHRNHLAAGD